MTALDAFQRFSMALDLLVSSAVPRLGCRRSGRLEERCGLNAVSHGVQCSPL
jgi:hypothetical protein